MRYSFFLSSMMGITDGVFCAERSAGCSMVQIGAYLAEPTANSNDMGNQSSSFLPPDWDKCTQFLAQQCQDARSLNDVKVCLNLASPRLDWGLKAAESFKQAGGDTIELNVHGGYQRYQALGKLRAMVLPENQAELYQWVKAFSTVDIPLIVKFNGQYDRPNLIHVLEKLREFDVYGLHINIRQPSKQPDLDLTRQVRALHNGLLLVSGYVRSGADAYRLFVAGADMVGIAEPTIADAGYIGSCLKEMGIDRRQRVTFDEVADLYDEARPGYPDVLIDDIIDLSNIAPDGRILEIGTGPGNATLPFAQRGYKIMGIELGANLAAKAVKKCRIYPDVTILNMEFEDWRVEEKAFDLAISAQALHWIPPHIAYPRIALALKDTGSAAFFWRVTVDPQTEWSRAIDAVYQEITPKIKSPNKGSSTMDWTIAVITDNFKTTGGFGEVTHKAYHWTETISGDKYIKDLMTSPNYHDLDASVSNLLYSKILAIFEKNGGSIAIPQSLALFLARVKR